MGMVVHLLIMTGVVVIVRPVCLPVLMIMGVDLRSVIMLMLVLVQVVVGVHVGMSMGMHRVPVNMLVGMGVGVLVGVHMFVFVISFHNKASFHRI